VRFGGDKVTPYNVEHTEMRANIMTSWGASTSALIGPLLSALHSDWLSYVMPVAQLGSYMLYLVYSYLVVVMEVSIDNVILQSSSTCKKITYANGIVPI
jgi:hypothetical protein